MDNTLDSRYTVRGPYKEYKLLPYNAELWTWLADAPELPNSHSRYVYAVLVNDESAAYEQFHEENARAAFRRVFYPIFKSIDRHNGQTIHIRS